jgi:hypothetical protein
MRATVVLLAVGTLALLVRAVHAARHPLWLGSEVVFDPPQSGSVTFSLRNSGFAEVELKSLALQPTDSSALPRGVVELTDVRVGKNPSFATSRSFESAELPVGLEGRSNAFVELRLKPLGCGTRPLASEVTLNFRCAGIGGSSGSPSRLCCQPAPERGGTAVLFLELAGDVQVPRDLRA